MRVAIFGAGGVGGYLGGRLAAAGADVHLLARGAHLEAIRRDGLRIESIAGDVHVRVPATADVADIGRCDVVLLCVKSYDTTDVARRLAPLLGSGSAVLSLQNGVDNEERLADIVGAGRVMGGVAYVFATIKVPGVIVHADGPGSVAFGEMDGEASERGALLARALEDAGVPAEFVNDIRSRLWQKLSFIVPQAGMTAISRAPIGAIRASEAAWAMYLQLAKEVIALARCEGVELPADQLETVQEFARALDGGSFSSLHYDLVHGKRLELEALHGYVSRRSHEYGLSSPACDAVVAALEPHLNGA